MGKANRMMVIVTTSCYGCSLSIEFVDGTNEFLDSAIRAKAASTFEHNVEAILSIDRLTLVFVTNEYKNGFLLSNLCIFNSLRQCLVY